MRIRKYHHHPLCVSCFQLCPTLWDPMDCSPPGSSVHRLFQAKNIGVGGHFLLQGIFSSEGANVLLLRLLHLQADSLPRSHLGSPPSLRFLLIWWLRTPVELNSAKQLKNVLWINLDFWNRTGSLYNRHVVFDEVRLSPCPGSYSFLPSSVPLISLATETYPSARARTVARLRPQNSSGIKQLLLLKLCLVLSLGAATLSAYTWPVYLEKESLYPRFPLFNFPSTGSPPSAFLLFSCSVMSNSLKPHGSQHARIPCPSLSPRACSNSCPVSQSHHPTISPLCLLALNPHLSLYWVDFSTLTAPSPPTSPPRPTQWTCWVLTTRPPGNS